MREVLVYGAPIVSGYNITRYFMLTIVRLDIVNQFTFQIEDAINFANKHKPK